MPQHTQTCRRPQSGGALRGFLLLLAGLAAAVLYMLWSMSSRMYGFQPPEMALAQYTPVDVVGDLGGMKVRIPRHYAEYVEYDDDPGFGERRKGSRPKRTFDSKLRSFGISVRFPDMKGLENARLREEMRRLPQRESNWIRIRINAGEDYPGDGFLDRRTNSTLLAPFWPGRETYWWNTYERTVDEDEHGLEAWRLSGINPRTGQPARESENTDDIYIHRDSSGKVDAYINCMYPSGSLDKCYLNTTLSETTHVVVTVGFRRALLPEWKRIQQSSRELLLSFEANPASDATHAPQALPTPSSR